MKEIKNIAHKSNPGLDGQRNICERRATTIAYMLDEAKKQGLKDDFARTAIYRYGEDMGIPMNKNMKNPDDLKEFESKFAAMPHRDIYEMTTEECSDERLLLHFHYCPYVKAWMEQGWSQEEIENLCDIAMEGDRAIGNSFPNLMFTLGKTIAQGNPVCELEFVKVKK